MHHRHPRFPTDINVLVEHDAETHQARLVNISSKGARISQLGGLPSKAQVTLRYLHLRLPAHVVWSVGRLTGLELAAPLSNANLYLLRKSSGSGG